MTAAQPGDVIAERYVLREELGRGGMGVVWRARDVTLDREVAVKEVLLPDGMSDTERETAHARVRREGRTAARVSHPSVVTVHDVFVAGGHPWVVMEFLTGESLQDRLARSGPVSPELGRHIAESMLRALREAHRAGVAHRDIKPGNIMICADDRVVLTDFGIAVTEDGAAITGAGMVAGSPEYIAPERMDGDPNPYASDLWSLGVTLFHAVEGISPFRRETLTATAGAVAGATLPPPRRSGALAGLLAGLVERDVARRLTVDAALELLSRPDSSPPRWSPMGGTVTGPLPASAPPPPAPPTTGGYVTGPRPLAAPSGGHPTGSVAPMSQPAPPAPATPVAGSPRPPHVVPPPAEGDERRPNRYLPLMFGGIGAVVLTLVFVTVWMVLGPEPSYQTYSDADFVVDYPSGWGYEETAEDDLWESGIRSVEFRSPDEDMLIEVDRSDPVDRSIDDIYASEDFVRSEYDAYERIERTENYDAGLPESWDTSYLEGRYVGGDWPTEERHVAQLTTNPPDGDSYTIIVNMPDDGTHGEVLADVIASFEPQVGGASGP